MRSFRFALGEHGRSGEKGGRGEKCLHSPLTFQQGRTVTHHLQVEKGEETSLPVLLYLRGSKKKRGLTEESLK